jgi:hypothetical protein
MKKPFRRVCPLCAAELGASAAAATVVSPIVRPGLSLDPEPAPWVPVYIPVLVTTH